MNEMTLSGLLRSADSWYTWNRAEFLVVVVEGNAPDPEIIVNPRTNFEAKVAYYAKAYNEDLTLKANPSIKITDYNFVERIDLINYF